MNNREVNNKYVNDNFKKIQKTYGGNNIIVVNKKK